MLEATALPVRERAPLGFRVAKWMQAHGVRGGYRLEAWLRGRGRLDLCVRHVLGDGVTLDVPIALRPYDRRELEAYEQPCVAALREATRARSTATGSSRSRCASRFRTPTRSCAPT